MAMKKTSDLQARAVELHSEGKSVREIESMLNIPKSTVARIIKKRDSTGSLERKAGSGRLSLLSNEEKSIIKVKIDESPLLSAAKLAGDFSAEAGKNVSPRTMQRYLGALDLKSCVAKKIPLLTKKHKESRLALANEWANWTIKRFRSVIFSDECKFNLFSSDGRARCWRGDGKRLQEKNCIPTVKHGGGSVMVWGCISYHGVGRLVIIDGIMDAIQYRRILAENLEESANQMGLADGWVFQQDNDPKHTSKKAKEFFTENKFNVLKWPSQSPDMNPIEHVWAWMKSKLRNSRFKNKGELIAKLKALWTEIPPEFLHKLIDGMPRRAAAVISANGGCTSY